MSMSMNALAFAEEAMKLLHEFEMALFELEGDADDAEQVCLAHRVLRTLSGAGRMFGYIKLAEMAAAMEPEFLAAVRGQDPVDGVFMQRAGRLLQDMRTVVDEGPQSEETKVGGVILPPVL